MALMHPISGSAAKGIVTELVNTSGPVSLSPCMALVMDGSTETTFNVLAEYLGWVGVKNTRYGLPAALLVDLSGIVAAGVVTQMVFG